MSRAYPIDHIHTYEAIPSGKQYKCTDIGCPHSISRSLIIGRTARCPYCFTDFIITREHLRRKKIHCMQCKGGELKIKLKDDEEAIIEKFLRDEVQR